MYFRTALNAVGKNAEDMNPKIYAFSTMEKSKDPIWILQETTYLEEQKQLYYETACQKDTNEGDKEIWTVVIAVQDPTQLFYTLCSERQEDSWIQVRLVQS